MASAYKASGGAFVPTQHAKTYDYISPLKLDLTGKTALVTGAAFENGVGYATATALVRAGISRLALVDQHGISESSIAKLKAAAEQAGRDAPVIEGYEADISSLKSVQAIQEPVSKALNGRLDILINNAGVQQPPAKFLDIDPEVYWRVWEVNVRGLFNMSHVFLPLLLSNRKADSTALCTMLNVASSGALSVRPNGGSYRSSKLAVLRWTEHVQVEYADEGLLAYCVNPGAIMTEITQGMPMRERLPHEPSIAGDTIAWLVAERREWIAGRYVSCPWDMEEFERLRGEIVEGDKLKMEMKF